MLNAGQDLKTSIHQTYFVFDPLFSKPMLTRQNIASKFLASHVSVLRRNKATNSNTSKDATLLTNNSQHCSMLHVASVCTPCCMLLNVVACCCAKFETGQTFNLVQTDATLLTYNLQHCWELLRPFARSQPSIFQLHWKPLHLVIYSSFLALTSYSHGKFAAWG